MMRIDGSLPMHIARAYGIAGQLRTSVATPVAAPSVATKQESADSLIAGRVQGGVAFDGISSPARAQAFQLYTRAADRIEVATAVELGRSIDVRG